MKHIWTELGRLEHEARVRQLRKVSDRSETEPGWLVKPIIQAARMVREQVTKMGAQVKENVAQPEDEPQDQRITGKYRQVSSN